jgi:hypothetical protein
MFNNIKSECFLSQNSEQAQNEQVKDNIKSECYVHDIMRLEFLLRRTLSRMIWESLKKG